MFPVEPGCLRVYVRRTMSWHGQSETAGGPGAERSEREELEGLPDGTARSAACPKRAWWTAHQVSPRVGPRTEGAAKGGAWRKKSI